MALLFVSSLARARAEAALGEIFKLSRDPEFSEKLQDIVGLYLNPPEHAMVLCADEKSRFRLWIEPTTLRKPTI